MVVSFGMITCGMVGNMDLVMGIATLLIGAKMLLK